MSPRPAWLDVEDAGPGQGEWERLTHDPFTLECAWEQAITKVATADGGSVSLLRVRIDHLDERNAKSTIGPDLLALVTADVLVRLTAGAARELASALADLAAVVTAEG